MKRYIGITFALAAFAVAQTAQALHYTEFYVELDGANEVGAPGDPDGTAWGTLKIDPATNELVWNFWADNILVPITGFHIHNAPAGENGPVAFNFQNMFSGSAFDPVAANILAAPQEYYLNIHTQEHLAGAVRGQVAQAMPNAVPDASATALGGLAIALCMVAARRARGKETAA